MAAAKSSNAADDLGPTATRHLMQQVLDDPAAAQDTGDPGLKIDRTANMALIAWGRLPLEVFLSEWRLMDADILHRACHVLGRRIPKRWTLPQKTDLHRRAQRFARNTVL